MGGRFSSFSDFRSAVDDQFKKMCPCCSKNCCLTSLKWVFVGFCFAVFGVSIALLVLSAQGYSQMRAAFDELQTQKRFDLQENQFADRFRPEAALGIFYFGIVMGIILMIVSFMGLAGGYYEDGCYLIIYACVMGGMILTTIIGLAIAYRVHYDDLSKTAIDVYSEFVKYLYGQKHALIGLFAMSVDTVQEKHRCCGVLDTITSNDTLKKYGADLAQYLVVYWIESTQWGHIQLQKIGYEESKPMLFTPTSCCRVKTNSCSNGTFGYHYRWNATKEAEWASKIYTEGCGRYLLDFGHLPTPDQSEVITVVVLVTLGLSTSVLLALVLAFCKKHPEEEVDKHEAEKLETAT